MTKEQLAEKLLEESGIMRAVEDALTNPGNYSYGQNEEFVQGCKKVIERNKEQLRAQAIKHICAQLTEDELSDICYIFDNTPQVYDLVTHVDDLLQLVVKSMVIRITDHVKPTTNNNSTDPRLN